MVAAVAAVGVAEHVKGNYDSGPLDIVYSATWASMSMASRVWAAVTQSVGPSPILAPLALIEGALCIWAAGMLPVAVARSGSELP